MRCIHLKTRAFVLLFVALFLGGFFSSLRGAAFYVATNGNDSNNGSQSSPFRSVVKGISVLSAGDTLYIRGGAYPESIDSNAVIIPTGSDWSNAPLISAYNEEPVTLRNMNLAAPSSMGQQSIQYVTFYGIKFVGSISVDAISFWGVSHHVKLQNCEATGALGERIGINMQPGPAGGGSHQIINCKSHHNGDNSVGSTSGTIGHGVYVGTSNNLFDRLDSYNNGDLGLQIYSEFVTPSNNTIRNSKFHDNSVFRPGPAIIIGGGDNNLFYNNLIYSSVEGLSIGFRSPTNTKVYYNTITGTNGVGLEIRGGSSGTIVKDNIVYQTGGISDGGSGTTLSNNLTTDPKFFNSAAADFHLLPGSPAIGAGVAISGITTDFDGRTRANPPSIGAYEGAGGGGGTPPAPSNVDVTQQTQPPPRQTTTQQQPPYQQLPPSSYQPPSSTSSTSGPSTSQVAVPFLVAGVIVAALVLGD